jgi:hypothetical protein|tara:strand:- start:1902 stop:2126 length:225 start_codon:yes stop_codon:yes gene_type:complete
MKTTRKVLVASTAFAGLALAGLASAQDMYKSGVGGLYAGLNYTFMETDFDGLAEADTGTLSGKVGVMATDYFGV